MSYLCCLQLVGRRCGSALGLLFVSGLDCLVFYLASCIWFSFLLVGRLQSPAVYMAKLYPRCQLRVGVSCKFVHSTAVSWSGGILFHLGFSGKVFYVGCICRMVRC